MLIVSKQRTQPYLRQGSVAEASSQLCITLEEKFGQSPMAEGWGGRGWPWPPHAESWPPYWPPWPDPNHPCNRRITAVTTCWRADPFLHCDGTIRHFKCAHILSEPRSLPRGERYPLAHGAAARVRLGALGVSSVRKSGASDIGYLPP